MKEKFRRLMISATLTLFVAYYAVRLFTVLYAFVPDHSRAEAKRLERYGNKLR